MRKRIQDKSTVPAFRTEEEEAKWWFENRAQHAAELSEASVHGTTRKLTRKELGERISRSKRKPPSPVVALRIPATDLELARKQADEKGLPYQTYIKSLLHETLLRRERSRAGK